MTRVLDLEGQRFGSRTVMARAENSPRGTSRWVVQCDCGKVDTVDGRALTDGNANGCMKCRVTRVKTHALLGETFGTRTVIGYSSKEGCRVVECECGYISDVDAHSLTSGRGCFHCFNARRRDDAMQRFDAGDLPGWYWTSIRKGAQVRGLELTVDREGLKALWLTQGGRCALTGWELTWSTWRNKLDTSASLDRIDSSQGYVSGNVQWVHKLVNVAKMDQPNEEFIEMCRAVAEHADTL